jgi:hypothetical protein
VTKRDGHRSGGDAVDEPPPLLGSWRNLYTLLLVELATLIVLFTSLGWWAS